MRFIALFTILLVIMPIASAQTDMGEETAAFFLNLLKAAADGTPSLEDIGITFGEFMTTLACGCMDDDSCDQALTVFCSGFIDIPGADFLDPVVQIASDPSHAMCAAGFSLDPDSVPPGIDRLEPVTDAIPEEPSLMIEAARIISGDDYTYALRYHVSIADEDFDDYENMEYTVKSGSQEREVSDFAPILEDADVFPITATFVSSTLYTHACISFDEVPSGLPASFCVPIAEVDS